MSNKEEIQTVEEPQVDSIEHLTEEEKAQLEELVKIMQSKEFKGFSSCGHEHNREETDGEPGPIWNDMGHRLVVERAIWILTAIEPGSGFLSLWSQEKFRKGFYDGIYAADYESPYNNKLFGVTALYTSHFYNPENKKHFGMHNYLLSFLKDRIEDFDATAYTQVLKFANDAAKLHECSKKDPPIDFTYRIGYQLGLATHYFTDLTQPMHAANFAAIYGKEGNQVPNFDDYRHSHFEKLADEIIKKPKRANFQQFFCDPGEVTNFYGYSNDDLPIIVDDTARTSKHIFDNYIDIPGRLDNWPRGKCPPEQEAMEAYKRAFPAGQLAMAKFFQLWARLGENNSISKNLRSDHVAVAVRIDYEDNYQPSMFYKKDGDLKTVFRFKQENKWYEDETTFKEYGGSGKHGAAPFAACFDINNDHVSLFHVREDFGLDFWEVSLDRWKKTEIPNLRMNGSIATAFDQRYNKPSAFIRGANGVLYYIHHTNGKFAVSALEFAKVGGAISAVWDENDAGLGGDVKGHMAATYIGGDGAIHHVHVRNGVWKACKIGMPNDGPYAHADAQTLATIWDAQKKGVGIFWGKVTYEQIDHEIRERLNPELHYSLVKGNGEIQTIKLKDVTEGSLGEVYGGIGAVSNPEPTIFFMSKFDTKSYTAQLKRRSSNEEIWNIATSQRDGLGMVDATTGPKGSIMVGCRIRDRTRDNRCYISNGILGYSD